MRSEQNVTDLTENSGTGYADLNKKKVTEVQK